MSKNTNGFESFQKMLDQWALQQVEDRKQAAVDRKQQAVDRKQTAELKKSVAETTKSVKELRKELGGLGNSFGSTAEGMFFNSIEKSCRSKSGGYDLGDVHYDDITHNVRVKKSKQMVVEIDIMLDNERTIAMIEVKAKVDKGDIDDLLERRYPRMQSAYPQCTDTRLYLAALDISDELKTEALHRGVSVLQLAGDVLVTNVADGVKPNGANGAKRARATGAKVTDTSRAKAKVTSAKRV